MDHNLGDLVVYRCSFCGIAFEDGVADPGPAGEPRCPQCGLYEATVIEGDPPPFVVRRTSRFR
jgi:hypothetical protein